MILLQSATMATLVVQVRRRRRVEGKLAVGRVELAHLSRTVQLGELSGARGILDDIASDDRRAAGVITDLRRLMAKGEAPLAPVDLTRIVDTTLALIRNELVARQTRVDVRHEQAELTVSGNAPQLQQVAPAASAAGSC